MKKHHVLLVLVIAGIAAFFLNQTRNLNKTESKVREELVMLRNAVKRSPGSTSTLAGKISGSRPSGIDPEKFTADLTEILKAGPGGETGKIFEEFTTKYEARITSAPLSKLKEICAILEKDFPFDGKDSGMARRTWLFIMGLAAKSDPAWAFAKFDETAAAAKAPIDTALGTFKRWASLDGESMNPAYAAALQKWLDAAQAAGRIEESDPLVAGLRADIAAAQGDPSAAIKQIARLTYQSQRKAAIDYVQTLQTPEARRQAMEELSTALDVQNFPYFIETLTDQQGFDAAREILGSASLTPEKHDLAAATIAAAKIGPETRDRAAWLLETLRSDDGSGLDQFTATWTRGNYADAANWITNLQSGRQRDTALKGFIPVAARIDGATAMDWALTVSDPLLRNRMYCEAHAKWEETDATQANAYRKAKPLDMEAVMAASKP